MTAQMARKTYQMEKEIFLFIRLSPYAAYIASSPHPAPLPIAIASIFLSSSRLILLVLFCNIMTSASTLWGTHYMNDRFCDFTLFVGVNDAHGHGTAFFGNHRLIGIVACIIDDDAEKL